MIDLNTVFMTISFNIYLPQKSEKMDKE